MIPKVDPDGFGDSDEYDAAAIADMATGMRKGYGPPMILSGWHNVERHPDIGTWLTWPWENSNAWGILDGDVDRAWFTREIQQHLDSLIDEAVKTGELIESRQRVHVGRWARP